MVLSNRTQKLIADIDIVNPRMGDIKKRAKEIGKDHDLALELWSSGEFVPRMLAVLAFDKKQLTQSHLENLAADMMEHPKKQRDHLCDWLLANQLMKDKTLTALTETWVDHDSPMLRRLYWYHQARLRWMGKTPPENSDELMVKLEAGMAGEAPVVQWAMNFCAGQIGVHEPKFRARCTKLGKELGLYKDDIAPKNCTPNYLPEFIRIEVEKRTA